MHMLFLAVAAVAAAAAAALQNEPQLLQMLDEVQQGLFTLQTQQILIGLQRPLDVRDGIEPTQLYPKNKLVRHVQREGLQRVLFETCTVLAEAPHVHLISLLLLPILPVLRAANVVRHL
jgi:hypothetical protein